MKKQTFLQKAKVTNYKEMKGHDGCPSFNFDLKFDGVKICNVFDDSYGGELRIHNYKGQSIEDIYKSIDEKSLWDEKHQWTTCLDLLLHQVREQHIFQKEDKKGVLIGDSYHNYSIIAYKGTIENFIKKYEIGKRLYQDIIDEQIKKGENILNKDYLLSLGFNFNVWYNIK